MSSAFEQGTCRRSLQFPTFCFTGDVRSRAPFRPALPFLLPHLLLPADSTSVERLCFAFLGTLLLMHSHLFSLWEPVCLMAAGQMLSPVPWCSEVHLCYTDRRSWARVQGEVSSCVRFKVVCNVLAVILCEERSFPHL